MSENNNSVSITNTNSQNLSIVPKHWRIPLTLISYIKGYDGVDEYVLEILKDRLSAFADSREELGESFQKYMQNIEGLEGITDIETTTTTEEEND